MSGPRSKPPTTTARTSVRITLANVTAAERRRFHRAKVPYSGQDGADGKRTWHEPYIATNLADLRPALKALGWTSIRVERVSPRQWIVRDDRRTAQRDLHLALLAYLEPFEQTVSAARERLEGLETALQTLQRQVATTETTECLAKRARD